MLHMTMLKLTTARIAVLLGALLFGAVAQAQLVVDITRGQENAVPVAVVPFGWTGTDVAPFDVAQVIASDLHRSGRFEPVDLDKMVDRPTTGQEIRFDEWRSYIRTDFIVVGKLMAQGADRYAAQFELYNVLNGQRLAGTEPGRELTATAPSLRALSHRISDIIYEKLTGVRGAFSTRIAYVTAEGTPPKQQYKLIVADYDGENAKIIRDQDEPIMSPAWSPDGAQLAYVSFEGKMSAIYVQTLRTAERTRVSARAGINGAPSWSPDGSTLALTLSRKDGDVDIYTLKLQSQELKRMTFDPGIDTEPTWSADGRKLYFNSDRAGSPQIYEIDVASPERATRITFDGPYNARPRLSPDGKQLAVVLQDNGNFRIGAVDLKSRSVRVLSDGRQDESPSFAPNGAMVIYATQVRGRGRLATAGVDTQFQQTLKAQGDADQREPVWSPFPAGR
jgi:TolB protein